MSIKERFENVGFTPEEKTDLIARLERAAEQEDNMTDATKRKVKRISGSMVFGIAAAVVMTAGALAAVLTPGLRDWFDTTPPGASEVLESSIYRIDRSQTYEGWTVSLGECVGDDNQFYLWVDVAAPEGTVFTPPGNDWIFRGDTDVEGIYGSRNTIVIDEDPTDSRFSLMTEYTGIPSIIGETKDIKVGPITDCWWEYDQETGEPQFYEGGQQTQVIRDHIWVFEDVYLGFPDQTVRLKPNVEVPYLNGTTTVTELKISPLGVSITLEGGSCAVYRDHIDADPAFNIKDPDQIISVGGTTLIAGGTPSDEYRDWSEKRNAMAGELIFSLTTRDDTKIQNSLSTSPHHTSGRHEGLEGPETPFISCGCSYADSLQIPLVARVINPAQVDHVTVCGVDIPVNPENPSAQPEQTQASQTEGAQTAATVSGVVTPKRGLNIRSGPGTRYQVVTTARKGTQVAILEEDQGFYKVSCPDGTVGYASKKYISVE